ncbi:MAG: DUF2185 domain-containing protein [Nocardiaceae bacterium]|nr:DUF2185 domain-containing protein [Nocardiaceae bacterium]
MPETLGTVTFPSGEVLLIDFGLLRLWSADRSPLLHEDQAPPETIARANRAVDLEVVGPDAAEAAAQIDLATVKGRYGFDQDPDNDLLARQIAGTGLDATVREIPRMAHFTRVHRLLDDDPGGTEVPFHGGWAVAVRGVPTGPLVVRGERMPAGAAYEERWRSVWVECATGEPEHSAECGYVLVDEARLLFADPAALNAWHNDDPADGMYDLAFWGRDQDVVGARVSVDAQASPPISLEGPAIGWTNLVRDDVVGRLQALRALKAEGLRFAYDIRPHDDHYRLLQQMYRTPTESGVIEVGGAHMTGWFTSWGDGAFPVFRDLAADGTLLRVRVELGGPEIVARQRRMERLWFGDLSKLAIVTARVAGDGAQVCWLYREAADRENDSGWRVFAGDESQDYIDDAANSVLVPLRELIEDAALEEVFEAPVGSAFERVDGKFVKAPFPAG